LEYSYFRFKADFPSRPKRLSELEEGFASSVNSGGDFILALPIWEKRASKVLEVINLLNSAS
jgi:hypothetical protein